MDLLENYICEGVDGHSLIVALNSQIARYIQLQLQEKTVLHLDEVEVYNENFLPGTQFIF